MDIATIEKSLIHALAEGAEDRATIDMKVGDTVRIHVRIVEGAKSRIQVFEGTVISIKHGGIRKCFTVRKVSYNVGVERVFPLYSPTIDKIEVKSRHEVRRSKLYYLRSLRGKKARLIETRGVLNN